MNLNRYWRARLKEPDVCSAISWRSGGIKSEVVQCAEANRVSVLVFYKGLAVPGSRGETRSEGPWSTAISSVILGTVVCKSRMLWRRVEPNVVQYDRREKRINNFKGLNRAVKVLVIDGIFVMPHSGIWSCHLVTNPENAVISRIRFTLVYNCSGPSHDGRLLSHGRPNGVKIKIRRTAAHALLLVGNVIIHVALARVSLAPGVFMPHHVLCFGKIGGARILRREQVVRFNQNSVRRYVMNVAGVVIRCKT